MGDNNHDGRMACFTSNQSGFPERLQEEVDPLQDMAVILLNFSTSYQHCQGRHCPFMKGLSIHHLPQTTTSTPVLNQKPGQH